VKRPNLTRSAIPASLSIARLTERIDCGLWVLDAEKTKDPIDCVEQVDPAYIRKRPLPALTRIPRVTRNLVSTAA
jgi:hypothetical protein